MRNYRPLIGRVLCSAPDEYLQDWRTREEVACCLEVARSAQSRGRDVLFADYVQAVGLSVTNTAKLPEASEKCGIGSA